jgi:hypothetical protein
MAFGEPGSSWQDSSSEVFNGRFRSELPCTEQGRLAATGFPCVFPERRTALELSGGGVDQLVWAAVVMLGVFGSSLTLHSGKQELGGATECWALWNACVTSSLVWVVPVCWQR